MPLPAADFSKGEVTAIEPVSATTTATESGFTIKMPSGTPIPTPTVYQGRLYVSGGFSSSEDYCFDAETGKSLWGVELSDDGPSMAVPSGDNIILNTESCTIFALDAATGKMRWSHYMGDPMMGSPAVANGQVFTVYPASADKPADEGADTGESANAPTTIEKSANPAPTYVLACLDAITGDVVWRQWLDGDCITAPTVAGGELLVATLPGTLYRFNVVDGQRHGAWQARATCMPIHGDSRIFLTRRTDHPGKKGSPTEGIAAINPQTSTMDRLALNRPAPYLDRFIQESSDATEAANEHESANGIGGGFGGGFVGGQGFFSVKDISAASESDDAVPGDLEAEPNAEDHEATPPEEQTLDALAMQQQSAADNLGLGNVSTIQAYQGSRPVLVDGRLYNCMGDSILCSSSATGENIWSVQLDGDLKKLGGHLAAPPVYAEGDLFVATVVGDILRLDTADGRLKKSYKIGSELRYSPVVVNNRLYVGTQEGAIVCIELTAE